MRRLINRCLLAKDHCSLLLRFVRSDAFVESGQDTALVKPPSHFGFDIKRLAAAVEAVL
jgi:hypothetical protein